MKVRNARGLLLEAVYMGTKIHCFVGQDKKNPGRTKEFKTLQHRFGWDSEQGDEVMIVTEWLDDSVVCKSLADQKIPFKKDTVYRLGLRGLRDQNGVQSTIYTTSTERGPVKMVELSELLAS